jgi:hypothetical protein
MLALTLDWRRATVAVASALAVGKCETGENSGTIPEWCQRITGNKPPDYWCMSAISRIFERSQRHRSPLLLTGSCEEQRQRAIKYKALRTRAEFDAARAKDPLSVAGWIGLCIGPDADGDPHAHHTVLVGNLNNNADLMTVGPRGGFVTIEGNAADPTKPGSRNGDGLYEGRERGHPQDKTEYQFIDPAAYAAATT